MGDVSVAVAGPSRSSSVASPQERRANERLYAAPHRLPADPYSTFGLPEMSPSALDRTPSRSAPMPPDPVSSPLLNKSALGARVSPAPGARALPAEVCVECMMRDREMMDVDVTTPGVWARESDIDFVDALRAEEAMDAAHEEQAASMLGTSADRRTSLTSSRWGGTTDESVSGAHWPASSSRESIINPVVDRRARARVRIGRGHLVTQASLKLWTSMNPPASSHRWRTLQLYLAEQDRILRAERAGSEATEVERERSGLLLRERQDELAASTPRKSASPRGSSLLLSSGMLLERVNIEADERQAKKRQRASRRMSNASRRDSANLLQRPDEPLPHLDEDALRRYSTPLLGTGHRAGFRSSNDLRSTPRSPSPGRSSIAYSERPRSSFWPSRSGGLQPGHRSATASVFSFAPSGSMLDMHLGLSMDKHLPRVPSARSFDGVSSLHSSSKPKKRGLGKFFGKLNLASRQSAITPEAVKSAPSRSTANFDDYFDQPFDELLEPPNPSYLAGRLRSSVSSAPATPMPNLSPHSSYTNLSASRPTLDSAPATVDWVMSQPIGHEDFTPPYADAAANGLKREKSLPALPADPLTDDSGIAFVDRQAQSQISPQSAPPSAQPKAIDETRSMRKVKSKQSRGFLSALTGGGKSSRHSADLWTNAPDEKTLDSIVREGGFFALRYPSSR